MKRDGIIIAMSSLLFLLILIFNLFPVCDGYYVVTECKMEEKKNITMHDESITITFNGTITITATPTTTTHTSFEVDEPELVRDGWQFLNDPLDVWVNGSESFSFVLYVTIPSSLNGGQYELYQDVSYNFGTLGHMDNLVTTWPEDLLLNVEQLNTTVENDNLKQSSDPLQIVNERPPSTLPRTVLIGVCAVGVCAVVLLYRVLPFTIVSGLCGRLNR